MLAFRDGEAGAFELLVSRHKRGLYNFLLRSVHDRSRSEEMLQEVFLRVIRAKDRYQRTARFTTWIYTIARNLALDHLKSRRRHRETPLDAAASEEGGRVIYFRDVLRAGEGTEPGARAESSEDERRVSEALGKLSPAKREALILRVYAGLSYADVARVVDAPVGTVKFRIHEAVRDLGSLLGASESDAATGG